MTFKLQYKAHRCYFLLSTVHQTMTSLPVTELLLDLLLQLYKCVVGESSQWLSLPVLLCLCHSTTTSRPTAANYLLIPY